MPEPFEIQGFMIYFVENNSPQIIEGARSRGSKFQNTAPFMCKILQDVYFLKSDSIEPAAKGKGSVHHPMTAVFTKGCLPVRLFIHFALPEQYLSLD